MHHAWFSIGSLLSKKKKKSWFLTTFLCVKFSLEHLSVWQNDWLTFSRTIVIESNFYIFFFVIFFFFFSCRYFFFVLRDKIYFNIFVFISFCCRSSVGRCRGIIKFVYSRDTNICQISRKYKYKVWKVLAIKKK